MPSIWWTRRALSVHATLALCEPGFAVLCWWQLHRALDGNDLSWMYVFEWPFFGVYAVVLWWRIVHDQPGIRSSAQLLLPDAAGGATMPAAVAGPPASSAPEKRRGPLAAWWQRRAAGRASEAERRAAADEVLLAAYNRHLAALQVVDPGGAPDGTRERTAARTGSDARYET